MLLLCWGRGRKCNQNTERKKERPMDITKLCESEESFYAFDKVWKEEMSTPKA